MPPRVLKMVERTVKRAAFAVATRVGARHGHTVPDWGSRPHRVLFLRYDRIGDMLMATGLIRVIATSHPTIALDVLASPANVPVLDGNPHVRRVIVFDRRRPASFMEAVRAMRREHYDAVVAGMLVPSATTAALMLASGAPHRIGVAPHRGPHVYTIAVPPIEASRWSVEQLGRVALAFGVDVSREDWHYELYLRSDERARAVARWTDADGAPRIAINVSARTPTRRWPTERYGSVVRHIRDRLPGAAILVTGEPRDWNAAESVAIAGGAGTVKLPHVRDAFALIATADAVVTPDTSLAHAALATNTAAVVLVSGERTIDAPIGPRVLRVVSPGPLTDLGVGPVLDAIDRLINLVAARA